MSEALSNKAEGQVSVLGLQLLDMQRKALLLVYEALSLHY
jgi:hypothetical protein